MEKASTAMMTDATKRIDSVSSSMAGDDEAIVDCRCFVGVGEEEWWW